VTERIGIGFVGLGSIARERHVPGFRSIPGVELAAVATSGMESARRTAAELGIPVAHADWRAVIDDPSVDAVVVATWPDMHEVATLAALASGKHVLCQARMAVDGPAAARMLAASEARPDRVAMVVPSPFSLWADSTIARLLREGAIGPVRMVRAAFAGGVYGADPWRRLRRHSGNNTMSLGIIYEALIRWLPEATAVTASAITAVPTMHAADGTTVPVDVPDHLVAVAELPGPTLATIEISASPTGEPNAFRLTGTDGTLRADFDAGTLELSRGAGPAEPVAIPDAERADWRVEAEFIEAIREGTPVRRTDFATGVRYMAFTDAVIASIAEGRRVTIAP
jgi:predicted dehydrogenase